MDSDVRDKEEGGTERLIPESDSTTTNNIATAKVAITFLKSLTFGWLSPLLRLGNSKNALDPQDLCTIPLPSSCESEAAWNSFNNYWNYGINSNASLSKCLFRAFWIDFAYAGVLKLFHDCSQFVGPIIIRKFIEYLRDGDATFVDGLWLALAVTTSQTVMAFCMRHYSFKCNLTGLRMRAAIMIAVHKKALLLSEGEKNKLASGRIVNLVTIDAQRIQDLTTYLHAVWYSFIQISLAIYFLWGQLGISCLGGIAVIIISIPLNQVIAYKIGKLQKQVMVARDNRVEMTNEVLGCIKGIKLQVWEDSFQNRILKLREMELRLLKYFAMLNILSLLMWAAVPLLVSLSSFGMHVFLGKTMDISNMLISLALFDILRIPVCMLPQVINSIVLAQLSFQRIQRFLLSRDVAPSIDGNSEGVVGVHVRNGTFCFDMNTETPSETLTAAKGKSFKNEIKILSSTVSSKLSSEGISSKNFFLREIDFSCERGDFIVIVGSVGHGKSALINSLIGEMHQVSGVRGANGRFAYCSQIPFIMNDTVRNNILFSHIYNQLDIERYKNTLNACALMHDLKLLRDGDQTYIGERGFTCSGGQKARIALARSLYHDADIFLLDDPLAAVDAHVGKYLFRHCIVEEMLLNKSAPFDMRRQRAVVLVTHSVQYLSDSNINKIIVLDDGRIAEVGSYNELSSDPKSRLSSFLKSAKRDGILNETIEKCISSSDLLNAAVVSSCPIHSSAGLMQYAYENSAEVDTLMTSEVKEREHGRVDYSIYSAWSKAAGGTIVYLVIFLGYLIDQCVIILTKWWLTYWSRGDEAKTYWYLEIYAFINICAILTMALRVTIVYISSLRVSSNLFQDLLATILRSPMTFFDTTPSGRIINRFTKDVFIVDEKLVVTIRTYFATVSTCIGTIVVISCVTPIFLVFVVPMIFYYIRQQIYFSKTYRELKRYDLLYRSPLYSFLGETLDGLSTIRAFQAGPSIMSRISNVLNNQQNVSYLIVVATCWLELRLDMIGTLIVFFTCLCVIFKHVSEAENEKFIGLAGLSISFALSVTQSLNFSVRLGSDLEADFVSVERIIQYSRMNPEGSNMQADQAPGDWPSKGNIVFSDCFLRYRTNLPFVLKGFNLAIPAHSKVGIVGRTGAGKSTIMVALLRLVELSGGQITIDDVDISEIDLRFLRSKIAVIPQDPILFSGTIRTNLDPFDEFESYQLYDVLRRVGFQMILEDSVLSNSTNMARSLEEPVSERGSNLSVGQRQLLVLARALLKGAKVVIMDEATASVDVETDERIQNTIKTEFEHSTCITVAHRISSIMDSDLVLVMDDGRVAEFGEPSVLLQQEDGLFRNLVYASDEFIR